MDKGRSIVYSRRVHVAESKPNMSAFYEELSNSLDQGESSLNGLLSRMSSSSFSSNQANQLQHASSKYTLNASQPHLENTSDAIAATSCTWIHADIGMELPSDVVEHMRSSRVMQADRFRLLEYLHQAIGPHMAMDPTFLTQIR